jgi:multisubunit Na+/H+ antiporter MnhB subunit
MMTTMTMTMTMTTMMIVMSNLPDRSKQYKIQVLNTIVATVAIVVTVVLLLIHYEIAS